MRRVVAASALLATVAGCAMRHDPNTVADDDVATLSIINHHPLDVVIYSVRQGDRERIGEVTAASRGTFTLHLGRYAGNEIQLSADPIGSMKPVTSQVLHVMAGETVEWTLETDLARSFILVR